MERRQLPGETVIEVENLVRTYPGVRAVDGVSFAVRKGEIFGLLGPNGAGKTSLLGVLQGLGQGDEGSVRVLGQDVQRHARRIKPLIGVQLQSTSLLPELTAIEQVLLFARLYGRDLARDGALALLDEVGLAERAGALPDALSGGQKQRLALALALVNEPEIVFLDEPTAGLDPQARRLLWEKVANLRDGGQTVVLTTHYMEEAEALCNRVGILDHGRLLALDTPPALIHQMGDLATISLKAELPSEALDGLPAVQRQQREGDRVRLYTADIPATVEALLDLAREHHRSLGDLIIRQPSLEDVFLNLTGRSIRE